jgi:hypothetical protein
MGFQTLRWKCALLVSVCALVLGAASQAAADSIMVEWDPSSGQVGYRVHVGTQSGSYSQHFDVGSSTLFTFPVAIAGQRYCFAVSAYLLSSLLEGPNSNEVCGYSNAPPTLVNPGNRTSVVGQPVTLQLVGSDPQSQPLTYSATGLPPGLNVMASTGFISGTPTTAGNYTVTAHAYDGTLTASQTFTWVITSSTGGDTTPPTVTITAPTSAATYSTTSSTIALSGTAADNVGVTQVTWTNNRGGTGVATGTTNWSVPSIAFQPGTNTITVQARDAVGNLGNDVLTVTYTAPGDNPPGSVTLTGSPSGLTTLLWWTANPWPTVDVYRNGNHVWHTSNDGAHTDPVPGPGTYSYRICSHGSTTICSNTITVTVTGTVTPPPDTTAPTVSITGPTSASTFATTSSALALSGTSADNVGVTQVTWTNNRGGTGVATGTTSWSVPSIAFQPGTNIITVQARDAAGNLGNDVLTVTYTAQGENPPGSVTLTGTRSELRTLLSWTPNPWPSVDVYRNGNQVWHTSNDGAHTDPVPGPGTYSYRICSHGSTTICSNTITVTFTGGGE